MIWYFRLMVTGHVGMNLIYHKWYWYIWITKKICIFNIVLKYSPLLSIIWSRLMSSIWRVSALSTAEGCRMFWIYGIWKQKAAGCFKVYGIWKLLIEECLHCHHDDRASFDTIKEVKENFYPKISKCSVLKPMSV